MLKRNFRKALALLASALILCTVLPLSVLLSGAEGDNVVVNGGFEDGKNNWAFNSGTAEVVSDAHDGSSAIKLTNPGLWAEGAVQTVSTEANADYKIVWYSKRVEGNGAFNLFVMNANGYANLTTVSGQNWMNETSGNWVKNEYVVKTGDATSVMLKFSTEASNPGSILLDDISMVKIGGGGSTPDTPDQPTGGNMLTNGDFETGDTTGWDNLWGSNTVSIVAGRNGGSAMHVISGQWKHVRQKIAVEANTDYVITGWYKDVNDMTLLVKDGGDSKNLAQTHMQGASDWTKVTLTVNSGSYTELIVTLMGNADTSLGSFDDFTMVKAGSAPDQPDEPDVPSDPTAGKVLNGDFETGNADNWETWQSTTISADAKYEGSYGAHIKGDGSWGGMLNQTINLTVGKAYEISFWYKANANGFNWKLEKGDGTNYAAGWCNSTTWTFVKAEFTAETATAVLNFCGSGNNVAEDCYIDNVVLTELSQAADDGYILNGDFETGAASPWTVYGSTTVSSDATYKGSYGLHLIGNGSWDGMAYQDYTVKVGETYVVKMMLKTVSNGVNIQIQNPEGVNVGGGWFNAATWTEVSYEFTATSDKARINFCGGGNGAPESVYADNISVSVKGAMPTGIVNGDFEQGEEGWTLNSSFATIVDEFHGGAHALQLSNPSAWGEAALQSVAFEANTNYVITWYSKRVEGNGAFMFTVMDSNDQNLTVVSGQIWMNETSGNWVENKAVVTTGADGIIKIKLTAEADNAGTILLDDIVVTKQGEEPDEPDEPIDPTVNMVQNGDFSNGTAGWTWATLTHLDEENGYISGKPSTWLEHNVSYGEALTQMIKVEPNTDYVIIFYTRRISGNGAWDLFLMDGDTINNSTPVEITPTSGNKWFKQTEDAGWVKTKLEFNSAEMNKVFLKFGPEADNSGIFLLDDVSMHKKGYEPSEPDVPVIPESGMTMTSYGVLNNRPISADKNLLQNGNFESATGGQWDADTFRSEYVSVVEDSTTMFGKNSLYFNTGALTEHEAVTSVFWLELEPNTSYVFSAWLKGAKLADDNRGRATIGVMDVNGKFLADREIKFLDGTRQLVPTAWDDQWHLRSVEFMTGSENATIGIALTGWGSKLWVDDMALFEVGNGTKYMSANMAGGVGLSFNIDHIACADKDSLIPDPNMNKADQSKFWAGSYGWRNGFISFVDNEYEYGASMKYTSTGDNANTYIIKWIDVQPNTQYTFAVDIKILEDGFGRIGLLDNKLRDKVEFFTVSFDSYDYDDYENTGWRTVVTSFNTSVYDRIGIAFVDAGGEVLIDNMRLFKNTDGKNVVDTYIDPPANSDDNQPGDDQTGVDELVCPMCGYTAVQDSFAVDADGNLICPSCGSIVPTDSDLPGDDSGEEEEEIIIRRKKKKKPAAAPAGMDPMIWVWIGAGSAVALSGAAVATILLIKKQKKAGEATASETPAE